MTIQCVSYLDETIRTFEVAETDTHTRKLTLQGWSVVTLRSTAALPRRRRIPREMSGIFVEQSEQTRSGVLSCPRRSHRRTIARLI